jgi:hypothetical protein
MAEFSRSIAIVIGINQYQNGIPALKTAVADATAISQVLKLNHNYHVRLLVERQVTLAVLRSLLTQALPATIKHPMTDCCSTLPVTAWPSMAMKAQKAT